jgi:ABC-type nitrate/sulfonate/bicarbonate transport system permease component
MRTKRDLLWHVWLPLSLAGVWELASRLSLLDPLFFPAPSSLAVSAASLWRTGELSNHISTTLARTFAGFSFGALSGLAFGLAMGLNVRVRRSLEPLVSTLVASPKLSLLPLLMLVLGIGEAPRLALVSAAAFIVVALHALDAVRAVNPDFVDLARNHGARRWQLIRFVYMPSGLPQLLTGLRISLGRALAVSVSVEIVGAPQGIGHLIWSGWQVFATEKVYIGVLTAATLGASFHAAMRLIERAVVPWKS